MSEERITIGLDSRLPGGYGRGPINPDETARWQREKERTTEQYVLSSVAAMEQGVKETRERILDEAPHVEAELTKLAEAGRKRTHSAQEYRDTHAAQERRLRILEAQAETLPDRVERLAAAVADPNGHLATLRSRHPALGLPQVEVKLTGVNPQSVDKLRSGNGAGSDAVRAARAAVRRSEDVLAELEAREQRAQASDAANAETLRDKYPAMRR